MMQTQVTRKRPRGEDNAFPDPFHPRRATNSNPNQYEQHPQSMYNESQNQDQSLWSDQSMFALDAPALDAELFQYTEPDWPADAFQDIFLPSFGSPAWMASMPSFLSGAHTHNDLDHTGQAWLEQTLYPDVPSLEERFVDLTLDNPYSENAIVRHKTLRKALAMPEDGAVNGYIKFRIRNADLDERSSKRAKGLVGGLSVRSRDTSSPSQSPFSNIPYLPSDFGRGVKLDEVDSKLLKFYLVAYCQGRTLLAKTNFWLTEIASMMASEDAVKHAILALAGAYVLDYVFKDDLRNRTNAHYRKASELIGAALKRPEVHTVGEGDGIVAAILLLVVDDCVNWEIRRPKGEVPNWYRGAHLAKAILDHSDPGYRYWKRENVQCDRARAANANWTALACILGLAVTPLNLCDNDRNFGWLLEGSAREAHTIHGGTGLSPKLLHIYAQITYLAARMMKNPESVVTPLAAVKIQESLQDFRQRSELSEGYPTTTALLDSCILDVTGKVDNATKVTELTGETWVCAAKIYLHCRFFRKPRCHPDVIDALDTLIVCVRRMPCSGALFTSQAPFFCIFIMALVAFREEDRAAAREWFKTVLSAVSCRSSVPPVWDCIQLLWEWMDTELTSEEKFDDSIPIGQRRAWWEDMIAYLIDKVGWVSLT